MRSGSELEQLKARLSEEERYRASKFHFPQHQRRFIIARGLLRGLLADYLEVNPSGIQFTYTQRGKPELSPDVKTKLPLQFNVSHSEELVVYAVCLGYPVGVDVEYLRSASDLEQIAARFFTKWEYEQLRSLPATEKNLAFFRGWTRKEAYLKACGDGIAGGLDQIEVSLAEDAEIRQINSGITGNQSWHLVNLVPAVDYIGAIASPNPNLIISYGQLAND